MIKIIKKILKTANNLTEAKQSRLKLIYKIQEMAECGCSISEISRLLGKDNRTVKKYIIPNFIPESQIEIKKFTGVLPNNFIQLPKSLKEWAHLLELTEEEKLEIEEVRKEILI